MFSRLISLTCQLKCNWLEDIRNVADRVQTLNDKGCSGRRGHKETPIIDFPLFPAPLSEPCGLQDKLRMQKDLDHHECDALAPCKGMSLEFSKFSVQSCKSLSRNYLLSHNMSDARIVALNCKDKLQSLGIMVSDERFPSDLFIFYFYTRTSVHEAISLIYIPKRLHVHTSLEGWLVSWTRLK